MKISCLRLLATRRKDAPPRPPQIPCDRRVYGRWLLVFEAGIRAKCGATRMQIEPCGHRSKGDIRRGRPRLARCGFARSATQHLVDRVRQRRRSRVHVVERHITEICEQRHASRDIGSVGSFEHELAVHIGAQT